jgi:inositol transport system substrate-binding protein
VHDLLTNKKKTVNDNVSNPLITKENVQEYVDLYDKAGLLKQ